MTTELKRISLGEFAANLAAIIERVASAGESVVVENDGQDVVVVNPAVPQRPRKRDHPSAIAIGGRVASTKSSTVSRRSRSAWTVPAHSGRASKTQCRSWSKS